MDHSSFLPLLLFSCQVMSDSLWPHELPHNRPLSLTNSQSLPKFMSIELVMPSNHLILCCPILPPSIFPSIRVFSSESALCIRWPKYLSFSISPFNEYSGLISFRIDWFDLLAVLGTLFSCLSVNSQQWENWLLSSANYLIAQLHYMYIVISESCICTPVGNNFISEGTVVMYGFFHFGVRGSTNFHS